MSSHDFSTLAVEQDGAVMTIAFNRPDSLNALTVEVADELSAALRLAEDPGVRAVVLTGAGRAFSSGADLKTPSPHVMENGLPDLGQNLRGHFNVPVRQIRDLGKTVVAAVNGPAVGVACSYALACDLVLAARSAYFLLAFVNIGLVPDGGASALIPARVGAARFNQLALKGERLSAEDAFACGLVDGLEDDDALPGAAHALAQRMASGAVEAQGLIKRLVNEGPLAGLDAALDLEAELQSTRPASPEFVEGVSAFLQKRAPDFGGVAAAGAQA
jgi:2-(1,2-epoxy-1,2-dihydrophenyl)acetyl-CoA isomerase